RCPMTFFRWKPRYYSYLFGDLIYDTPPALLGELLHEELMLQGHREQFNEVSTGGALGYIPFAETSHSQEGCLIYPRHAALNQLHFRKMVLDFEDVGAPRLSVEDQSVKMNLNGTVRQISTGNMQENVFVGVRSDYHCSVWRINSNMKPSSLEVIQTDQLATCISVSPHLPGELLVASESGAAYLWTVGKGLHKFRTETENLYFNGRSAWRWCDYTAHPRVMMYADRTGVDLTDTRSPENASHTLFYIGKTAECKKGERVILPKYLRDVNSYHYLITTQYSAYILDERFPGLPVMKWEHMMDFPPMFSQVIAGASWDRSNKVLLGSQRSGQLMMLQYSGGSQAACQSLGPPHKLSSPSDCLRHLPVQVPHRRERAAERLDSPSAGLTALYHNQGTESLCVLQLSEAGDIFYQILRPESGNLENEETSRNIDPTDEEEESIDSTRETTLIQHDEQETLENNMTDTQKSDSQDTVGQSSSLNQGISTRLARSQTNSVSPSKKLLARWKHWLSVFLQKPPLSQKITRSHWGFRTRRIMSYSAFRKSTSELTKYDDVKAELKESMKKEEAFVGIYTRPPSMEVVQIPDPVDPSEWGDDLSKRLTASWGGNWQTWWEDKLGLNHDQKVEALRRKRRQQKRARRRMCLSGSFASSVSYQSDMDELSGWSSATSNFGDSQGWETSCSETGGPATTDSSTQDIISGSCRTNENSPERSVCSQENELALENATVASQDAILSNRDTVVTGFPPVNRSLLSVDNADWSDATRYVISPRPLESLLPQSILKPPTSLATGEVSEQVLQTCQPPRTNTPSSSVPLRQTTSKNLKRTNQDYLCSLLSPQEETQDAVEDEGFFPLASSSQTSTAFSQKSRTVPSSQGYLRSSQPKKSRMGF
ncbi:TAF1C polymerase, partial [Amia calva]|nr:TAF1C polymerase [Amia calva]